MIWIELLGPSGGGKSFIYQELLKQKIVLPVELCPYHPNKFVAHNKWCRFLLIRKFYRDFHKYIPIYNELDLMTQTVFKDGLVFYSDNQRARKSLEDYYLYKFKEFKFLQEKLKQNDIFFSEDGILHLSPVYFEEINPRLAIVLEKDKELILRQRRERAKTNPRLVEELFNEKELQAYLENYLLLYSNKLASLDSDKIIKIQGDKDLGLETTYEKIKKLLNQ